jgi:ribose transport system substrate-binding protein
MTVLGLGPHGERAAPPERVTLLPEDIRAARQGRFRVAIVMHTLESDWAIRLVRGIVGTLGECGAAVIDVVDSDFRPDRQIAALDRIRQEAPDAIISLPVANAAVADAHIRVARAGIRLTLVDNSPTGLIPGADYVTLVSADNYGLGRVAAELLSPHLPQGARIGLLGYDTDFFPSNQREIAFQRWMETERPDVAVRVARFTQMDETAVVAGALLDEEPDLAGLFVVWDTPCIGAMAEIARRGSALRVTTTDLGREVAISMAKGGPVVGIAAQRPFQQGETVARAVITNLLGRSCPDWIALPGFAVSQATVVEAWQAVWREAAPLEVLEGLNLIARGPRPA